LSALAEGVGAEVLVMGGDTRLFSFSVSAPTTVGVGVRASNDVVSAQITDSTGKILSEGIVHLLRLEPGRYVLAVQAPTHVAPVRIQPILIGLNPTPTTPPPEMIRRFVESNEDTGLLSAVAELKAAESNTEAGAERSPSGDEPNAEDDSGQEQPSEDSQ